MFAKHLKKTFYILFALFYLALSTHVRASIHLCGGNITSISLFEHNSEDACECGKMTDNSCCNDLNFQCKTDESKTNLLKQISFNFSQKFNLIVLYFHQKVYHFQDVYKITAFYIFDHKPPFVLLQLSAVFLRI